MIIMFQGTYGETLEFDCMHISNLQFLGAYRIAIFFHSTTMCLLLLLLEFFLNSVLSEYNQISLHVVMNLFL